MPYRHLSIEERREAARLRRKGASMREIARRLRRSASTLSRELERNSSDSGRYQPSAAHKRASKRNWSGSRLERDAALREAVVSRLERGLSPAQVAAQLKQEAGRRVISHETIYRFARSEAAWGRGYVG